MPSNIFATTGTSVSIIFIDKTKSDDKVMLMDASNLGTKVSLDDGQRTVLSSDEKVKITSHFKGRIEESEFSALVENKQIIANGYSVQAGQYVELIENKIDYNIDERLISLKKSIIELIKVNEKIDLELKEMFGAK